MHVAISPRVTDVLQQQESLERIPMRQTKERSGAIQKLHASLESLSPAERKQLRQRTAARMATKLMARLSDPSLPLDQRASCIKKLAELRQGVMPLAFGMRVRIEDGTLVGGGKQP